MERTPRRRKRSSTKQYPAPPSEAANGEHESSHAKVVELVAAGSRVLDVGCASGALAARLAARGNRVWGVDINAAALAEARPHCVETCAADLESVELAELFPGLRFDVVVFADVLEHIKEPWRLLESARAVLEEGGSVVASLPNFSHAAVRLAVFSGTMPYATLGILDDTHLRFFTREGVEALFEESGFRLQHIERTLVPFGTASDLVPDVALMRVPEELERRAREDAESDTLQFVVRAIPLPGPWDMTALRSRLHDVQARAELQAVGLRRVEDELARATEQLNGGDGAGGLRAALAEKERALEDASRRASAAESAAATAAQHAASRIQALAASTGAVRAGAVELELELRIQRERVAAAEADRDAALAREQRLAEALGAANARAARAERAASESAAQAERAASESAAQAERAASESAARAERAASELQEQLRAAQGAALDARERFDAAIAQAGRERAAHALERVRINDALTAQLAAQRDEADAALARLREAHASEIAAERGWFENALRERGAALAEREAELKRIRRAIPNAGDRALEGAVIDLRRHVARTEAELWAVRAQLGTLRAEARREALVRIALEHDLAGAGDEGAEFWREPPNASRRELSR